jgi:hypothetical protein
VEEEDDDDDDDGQPACTYTLEKPRKRTGEVDVGAGDSRNNIVTSTPLPRLVSK